jgi:hypothetical protein
MQIRRPSLPSKRRESPTSNARRAPGAAEPDPITYVYGRAGLGVSGGHRTTGKPSSPVARLARPSCARACLRSASGTSSPGVERRSHERSHTDAADAEAGRTPARAGPRGPAGLRHRTSTAGRSFPAHSRRGVRPGGTLVTHSSEVASTSIAPRCCPDARTSIFLGFASGATGNSIVRTPFSYPAWTCWVSRCSPSISCRMNMP